MKERTKKECLKNLNFFKDYEYKVKTTYENDILSYIIFEPKSKYMEFIGYDFKNSQFNHIPSACTIDDLLFAIVYIDGIEWQSKEPCPVRR